MMIVNEWISNPRALFLNLSDITSHLTWNGAFFTFLDNRPNTGQISGDLSVMTFFFLQSVDKC